MNEYLLDHTLIGVDSALSDEEMISIRGNELLHRNMKKRLQKELNDEQESDYDFYC